MQQTSISGKIDGPMIMYLFHYTKELVYTSKCIDEIYIRKANEECAYPIYKEPCTNTMLVSQSNNKEDIINLFNDTPEITEKIKSGEYHREDFEEMILEYNRITEQKK